MADESEMKLFLQRYEAFTRDQIPDLEARLKSTQKRLEAEFAVLDDVFKSYSELCREHELLSRMLIQLQSNQQQPDVVANLNGYRAELDRCVTVLSSTRCLKPRTGSLFIRFLLGRINVSYWKLGDRLALKNEYNKFKKGTTLVFVAAPALQLALLQNRTTFILHQLWLVYYYLTLSIRENILQANGSAIKDWWIYHHYLSLSMALLMLLFPEDCILDFQREFCWFAVFQGIVMLLQNAYQAKRSYVRKSLGKAKEIDVDSTETLIEKPVNLSLLVPLLFVVYAVEFVMALQLFQLPQHCLPATLLGVGFLVISIGNSVTTCVTVLTKQKSNTSHNKSKTVVASLQ